MPIVTVLISVALICNGTTTQQQAAGQPPQRHPQALSQPADPKDGAAIAVLMRMAAVSGWSKENRPGDVTAVGIVTTFSDSGHEEKKRIVIKARPGQLRTEFPDNGSIVVVNGERGKHVTSAGTQRFQPYTTFSMNPLPFLYFTSLVEYVAPDVSVAYLGLENVRGEMAHQIELKRLTQRDGPARLP